MADVSLQYSTGGQHSVEVPAGAGTADVVVYAAPALPSGAKGGNSTGGRLCRVIVNTVGSAILTFYDSATVSSGAKPLGALPAVTAIGVVYDFQVPFDKGIVAKQLSGTPDVTVTWNEDAIAGQGIGGR